MTSEPSKQEQAAVRPDGTRPLRVLHGPSGSAGQPWTISRGQRKIGMHADCLRVDESRYGYQADYCLDLGWDAFPEYARFLQEAVDRYDVFHFHFRPLFFFDSRRLFFPTALDLLTLRAAGKILVFNYRGSEIRLHGLFRQLSPYHYVDENPNRIVSVFPEEAVRIMLRYVRGVCHKIFVPDPELRSYVPDATIIPRAVDLDLWPYVGPVHDEEPLVVHAPSRRKVKGTDHVVRAVEALRNEGLRFRFELIEDVENSVAREKYRQCDILIDQLRIGWYGVLAVEAMALGKAVIAYVRDDLLDTFDGEPPVAVANPDTVKDVLRSLIVDSARRKAIGEHGRRFCEREHDATRVASLLKTQYEDAIENPPVLDVQAVMELIAHQRRMMPKKAIRQRETLVERFVHVSQAEGFGTATRRAIRKALKIPLR